MLMSMTEPTPDDGRETASFQLGDRTVVLREPSQGQSFMLLRLTEIGEVEPTEQVESALLFGRVLGSLFTTDADRKWVDRSLASDELDLSEYLGLAGDLLAHFYPDLEKRAPAPRTGPIKAAPAKRAARVKR